jgi:hypothetical protein
VVLLAAKKKWDMILLPCLHRFPNTHFVLPPTRIALRDANTDLLVLRQGNKVFADPVREVKQVTKQGESIALSLDEHQWWAVRALALKIKEMGWNSTLEEDKSRAKPYLSPESNIAICIAMCDTTNISPPP